MGLIVTKLEETISHSIAMSVVVLNSRKLCIPCSTSFSIGFGRGLYLEICLCSVGIMLDIESPVIIRAISHRDIN